MAMLVLQQHVEEIYVGNVLYRYRQNKNPVDLIT